MNFEQLVGRTISGPSSDYEVEAVVGLGGQAGILRCNKKLTNETVVLKITNKKDFNKFAEAEEKILEVIAETGRESLNTVTWNDTFMFQGHSCLEFEKLDISLDQYIQENPLGLKEIRPILYQLADALFFLESCQIVHGDLKPVNIMMADRLRRPLKVKLIDFGVAVSNPEDWMGVIRGTPAYMSPEMLLGLPFDLPFDMWSLGCVAAEMLTGAKLFPGGTEHDVISGLLKVMGMPPGHMMSQGLKDLLVVSPDASDDLEALQSDREAFVDLVTKMLSIDPAQRITPVQMLEHPFFSLSHLDPSRHHNYVKLKTEHKRTLDHTPAKQKMRKMRFLFSRVAWKWLLRENMQTQHKGPAGI
uniref:Protein kinase domain-containing protein n=1 Tax=Salarias fasciatus TaxID=181472 RepID=A0A672HEH8_SALFA